MKSHTHDQLTPLLDSSFHHNLSDVHMSNKACVTFDPASRKWIYDFCTSSRGSVCLFHKGNRQCNHVKSIYNFAKTLTDNNMHCKVHLLDIPDKRMCFFSLFQSSWMSSVFQGLHSSHKSAMSYIPSL